MSLTDELDRLRGLIDEVDRGIMEMLELRVKLARAVGLIKMILGRPLRDGERERVVLEKVREMASERGLNPSHVEMVFKAIMEMCLEAQRGE
mgnify:FL=1